MPNRGLENIWLMDSGCSCHITGNHRWFSSLTLVSSNEHIIFEDKGTGKVKGVGAIPVSESFILRDVALVGNLGYNLLSVLQLLEVGYEVRFKKGFSHVLDAQESLVCPIVPFGKVFRVDFLSSSGPSCCLMVMAARPGELLHMDTIGPSRVWSVGGNWLRNESRHAMRALRSDNGSEFKNDRFKAFCHIQGLEHQFLSPYVPQQNEVVERKNRTLVGMARTMFDEHRTPRKFWAEAINTACYVSNRIFLRAVLNKTSYELRFGWQTKVSHLWVFRYRCFVLKKRNLDKFEPHSSNGVFLGYATHSRAYRVWLLDSSRIVETCEVTFDETMPCTTPGLVLAGDDKIGTTIFEDDEEDVGVFGDIASAAAPEPAASLSKDDKGALAHSPSTTWEQPLLDPPVHAAGPAEDVGEIRQTPQGTFVHQSKYTRDLLRKFKTADASPHMTPMSTSTALDADEDGKEIDQKVVGEGVGKAFIKGKIDGLKCTESGLSTWLR
ncbi:hypothetical protein U9M48_018934 [Paspalum notatum var. saurae]|uniref:Integrase catalytic domain-containing protein n=1 Tax=Paspalum notatum var. saurae TaxID=547442 RepID=A0AAQ3WQ97_PASNO